jgi:hypothetical protein
LEEIGLLFVVASLATLLFEYRCRKELELELAETQLELKRAREQHPSLAREAKYR